MKSRFGVSLYWTSCAVILVAGIATVRAGEPCCTIKKIDARTRTVTVTETATGCTLQFAVNDAGDLKGLKVGSSLSLAVEKLVLVPASKPSGMSSSGQAASAAGGTTSCGSNVGRYANTKTCYVQKDGKWVSVPCTK